MSQLVKTKRQANFKDFTRFGAFKGFIEQKNVVFNLFVCKLCSLWHSCASFHSRFKLAHSCHKELNLHTNSLNKLLYSNYRSFDVDSCYCKIYLYKILIGSLQILHTIIPPRTMKSLSVSIHKYTFSIVTIFY
jgi:hypothetical protein